MLKSNYLHSLVCVSVLFVFFICNKVMNLDLINWLFLYIIAITKYIIFIALMA